MTLHPPLQPLVFFIHHALVCLTYGPFLLSRETQYFGCMGGLTEGTNAFLNGVTFLKRHPSPRMTWLNSTMGVLLWVAYIPCRLINLAYHFVLILR